MGKRNTRTNNKAFHRVHDMLKNGQFDTSLKNNLQFCAQILFMVKKLNWQKNTLFSTDFIIWVMEKQISVLYSDLHIVAKIATDQVSIRQMIHGITAMNFHGDGVQRSIERNE